MRGRGGGERRSGEGWDRRGLGDFFEAVGHVSRSLSRGWTSERRCDSISSRPSLWEGDRTLTSVDAPFLLPPPPSTRSHLPTATAGLLRTPTLQQSCSSRPLTHFTGSRSKPIFQKNASRPFNFLFLPPSRPFSTLITSSNPTFPYLYIWLTFPIQEPRESLDEEGDVASLGVESNLLSFSLSLAQKDRRVGCIVYLCIRLFVSIVIVRFGACIVSMVAKVCERERRKTRRVDL